MKHLAPESAERSIIAVLCTVSASEPDDALELLESMRLRADDFANRAVADVFGACADCLRRGVPLEIFTLEAALASSCHVRAAGGRRWLAPLLMEPEAATASAGEHARIVREASLRRRAVTVLAEAMARCQDPAIAPAVALADGFARWQELVTQTPTLGGAQDDVFTMGEMLDAAQTGRRELAIPTGIGALDEAIGGLQPGVLTMVGALPGVGKSALLATILRNVANSGRKVGLFSLEDERLWVTRRLLSVESGVPVFLLATRPLTNDQRDRVNDAGERAYNTLRNVIIDDRQGLSPQEVAQTAREMILQHGCKAIFVDHLGEMRFARSERYDLDVSDALAALRDIAKRHNVPVVVASHVRRKAGAGIETEPSLTDFANSSAPERMARVALGLSKPEEGGLLRVSVLKQTNGPSGTSLDLEMVPHAAMVRG